MLLIPPANQVNRAPLPGTTSSRGVSATGAPHFRTAVAVLLAAIAPLAAPAMATASAGPVTIQDGGTSPGGEPPGPAATPSRHHATTTLCRKDEHMATGSAAIRNDAWAARRICLVNRKDGPNFTVTRAQSGYSPGEPYAFPNIFSGWEWGARSPGTRLPQQVSKVLDPVTSWYSTGSFRRGTVANRAFDIWFTQGRKTTGQAAGTELMIWLDSNTGIGRHEYVRIDGRIWELAVWTAFHNDRDWHYVQYRLPPGRTTWHVRNLALEPFIRATERFDLLNSRWWWESTQAGFEIWRGGNGLGTSYFSFTFHLKKPRVHHKKK
jgi:cellulose 1,4-beta-cellobiosidase